MRWLLTRRETANVSSSDLTKRSLPVLWHIWQHNQVYPSSLSSSQVDRAVTFIPDLIEEEGLEEDEFDDVRAAIKEAFVEKRAMLAAHLEGRRALVEKLSSQERESLDAMRVIK